ncbi:MAG: hypothetical protein IJC48_05205 [Clostridia bacterium]|nr:hypothetical protein [Clostridia bacterium]
MKKGFQCVPEAAKPFEAHAGIQETRTGAFSNGNVIRNRVKQKHAEEYRDGCKAIQ